MNSFIKVLTRWVVSGPQSGSKWHSISYWFGFICEFRTLPLLLKLIQPLLRNFETSFLQGSCTFSCSFPFRSPLFPLPDLTLKTEKGVGLNEAQWTTLRKGDLWGGQKTRKPPHPCNFSKIFQRNNIYCNKFCNKRILLGESGSVFNRYKAVAWCNSLTCTFTADLSCALTSV